MGASSEITEWFELYRHDIYHYLLYRMGSVEVEDVVQEVFIKAFNSFHSFRGGAHPKTWLLSIAKNVAIDEMRKSQREQQKSRKYKEQGMPFAETPIPEDVLRLNEEQTELYRAIQKLKPEYMDVVILRGIKELSMKETANVLNWNQTKVRNTYHRALNTLRKQMEWRD